MSNTTLRPWVAAYEVWTGVKEGYFSDVAECEMSIAGWECYKSFKAGWDASKDAPLPLNDAQALDLARKHLDKGLSWAPHITRCTDLEVRALIRAVESAHGITGPNVEANRPDTAEQEKR